MQLHGFRFNMKSAFILKVRLIGLISIVSDEDTIQNGLSSVLYY